MDQLLTGQDEGEPALAGNNAAAADPMAAVDAAHSDGTLAADREVTDTPDELRALVTHWWHTTSNFRSFDELCEQIDADEETLNGGTDNEQDDDSENTTNHIFRNATQTVAMLVPEYSSLKRTVRAMVEPEPGEPVSPEVVQFKRKARGLARTLEVLSDTYLAEINFQTCLEAWVQDACHFPLAIVKVMWQSNLEKDAVSKKRLPDDQETMSRLRVLFEQFHRGDFTKSDYQWEEIRQLMAKSQAPQLAVRQGLIIEIVPGRQWRCDPLVTGPENIDTAKWQRQDIIMPRGEILGKWPNIDPDDLGSAQLYNIDDAGRWVKQAAQSEQARTQMSQDIRSAAQSQARLKDTDLLLVAEVYDAVTREILVLVEGLEYPAERTPMNTDIDITFPYEVMVLNRRSGRLAGFSDTQLQRKAQRGLNKLRTAEEIGRDLAQARWAYDPAQVTDSVMAKVKQSKAGDYVAIPMNGRDIRAAVMPLVGTHEFRAEEYDGQKYQQEMAEMAALPDAAKGGVGRARFSSEVQTAAAGTSILTEHRQGIINRCLANLVRKIDQFLLFYCGPDAVAKFCGPLAPKYWPADHKERRAMYEWLHIKPDVNVSQKLDQGKRMDTVARLLDAGAKAGARFPAKAIVKLIGNALGDAEVADLIEPDPNALVGDLMQATQEQGIQSLAPDALQAIAQLGAQAMQLMQQQQAQAMAQEAAAAGGALPQAMPPQAAQSQPPMPPGA